MASCLIKQADLLPDILKACQHFDQSCVVFFCNSFCHICSNNGLNKRRIFRHGACFGTLPQNILGDEHAGHISGKAYIFTGFRIFCMNTKTVCIRICGKNNICIYFFCKLKSKCPGIFVLRVRIWNCREVSVRNLLFFHNINLCETKLTENSSDRNISGSVKWCVNDLHILGSLRDDLRVDALFFQLRDIFVIKIGSDDAEQILCSGFIFFHCFYHGKIRYFCYFCKNVFIMRRCDLGTVFPVYFISVVFSRVMAGCDHNTGNTAKLTDCKRKLRCGTK